MPLVSVRTAAERLALSPRTVRDMARRGDIPIVRIGRLVRLQVETVEALERLGCRSLTRHTKETD